MIPKQEYLAIVFDIAQRLAPRQLRERHHAKPQSKVRTPASPLCRSMMRPKVFHGTYSMTCANSVLPMFILHPKLYKLEMIANAQSKIQIVDTHESLVTPYQC